MSAHPHRRAETRMPPESPARRRLLRGAFLCLAALIPIAISVTANAAVRDCSGAFPAVWSSSVPWAPIVPSGPIKNGDAVARHEGTLNLTFTVTSSDSLNLQGSFPNNHSYNQEHKAALLTSIPGAGIRVTVARWSYDGQVYGVSGGGFISGSGATLARIPVTTPRVPRIVRIALIFEIVVINAAAYKGGTLGSLDGMTSIGIYFNSDPEGGDCNLRTIVYPAVNLPGGPPPVIPPPPAPTCTFSTATLNQSVGLNPVSVSRVAYDHSPREAGMVGEKPFSISATQCDKDAKFRIYFTDNSNQGNTTQTLGQNPASPSVNQVGIRLYFDGQSTPMTFGPAPTDASSGLNYVELSAGNIEGASITAPFTAQYVMKAGVSNSQLTAGRVQAEATVTIVYP